MALSLEQIRERILHFRQCWRTLDPKQDFCGLSLAEFEAGTEESLKVRDEIRALEAELDALRLRRDQADRRALGLIRRFVSAVQAEPGFGDDCPFFAALGYIPLSQRKTGLTRRKGRHPEN